MRVRCAPLLGLVLLAACSAPPAARSTLVATSSPGATRAPSPPPAKVAASPSAVASVAPATSLVVSYSNVIGTEIPLWVGQESGIFARNGFDLDLRLIESSKGIPALLAGETQIGDMGGPEVLSAAAAGGDVVTLAVQAPVYPYVFMAAADIKTTEDLKGKKVAISNVGAGADVATRVVLRKVGLDPDNDVSIIATGSLANRTASMLSGQIQAGVAQPPDTAILKNNGLHVLFDLAALKLPSAAMVMAARRSSVEANRPLFQKYVDSWIEATIKARQDKPLTISVLKKYFKSTDDAAMNDTYDFYMGSVIPDLPYPKPELYADAKAVLGAQNEKAQALDLASFVDESFVQSSADRGVGYR